MTSLLELSKINVTSDIGAFIVISEHLLSQNEKSVFLGGDCAYRGSIQDEHFEDNIIDYGEFTGLSCAVGCLIKDQFYDISYEQNNIYETPSILDSLKLSHPNWEIDEHSIIMLGCLQKIHDSMEPEVSPMMLDLFASNIINYKYDLIDFDISVQESISKIMQMIYTSGFNSFVNNMNKNSQSIVEDHRVNLLDYISRVKNKKEINNG